MPRFVQLARLVLPGRIPDPQRTARRERDGKRRQDRRQARPSLCGAPVCFGNTEMFVGVGAIVGEESGTLTLYEGGTLAFVAEAPITVEDADEQSTQGLLTLAKLPRERKTVTVKG